MTLKEKRAPLLCCYKLCASFHSHQWIQTGVTVWKHPIWVKINVFFVLCDLEIWPMTLKNNRASFLCYFKLCALFRWNWWIKTWVTVWKHLIWVKIDIFLAMWPWNWTDDLEKQWGSCAKHHQALCIISSSYVKSNWSYGSEMAKFWLLWPWPLTSDL